MENINFAGSNSIEINQHEQNTRFFFVYLNLVFIFVSLFILFFDFIGLLFLCYLLRFSFIRCLNLFLFSQKFVVG